MADTEAKIILGADIGAATQAMSDVASAVASSVADMNASYASLGNAISFVKDHFAALAALVAGGELFSASMKAAEDWGTSVLKLSRTMGITTESASVLAVGLDHVGLTSDQYMQASVRLTRQLSSNEQAFQKLGIETRDQATGAWLPLNTIVQETIQKLGALGSGTQQNIAGQKVFGRGWQDIRAILRLNSEAMAEAAETAQRLNLIVGPEGAEMAWQYGAAHRDLGLVMKSLEIQIGNALMPTLLGVGKWLGSEGPGMAKIMGAALRDLALLAGLTVLAWKDMYAGFVAIQNSVNAKLFTGELTKINEALNVTLAKNRETFDQLKHDIENPPVAKAGTAGGGDQPAIDFSKDSGSRVAAWKAELQQREEASGEYFKSDLANQLTYWQEIATLEELNKAEAIGVAHEIFEIKRSTAKQAYDAKVAEIQGEIGLEKQSVEHRQELATQLEKLAADTYGAETREAQRAHNAVLVIWAQKAEELRKIDTETQQAAVAHGVAAINLERENADAAVKLGQVSEQQRIAMEAGFVQQEFELRRAALENQLSYTGLLTKEETVKLNAELSALNDKHNADMQKSSNAALAATVASWENALAPIGNAFGQAIQGMINRTQTWQQAMLNIGNAVESEFIQMGVKMVVHWAAMELAKTAATATGTAERTALEMWASLESLAIAAWTAIKKIAIYAWEAAAAAYQSIAEIPMVGPFLAPAMAAGAAAAVLAFASNFSSAEGGYDIPSGINPMVQAHGGEMVLPKELADNVRGMTDGGGGGNPIHVHIHALDSQDVARFMDSKGHLVVAGLKKQIRNGAMT